VDCDLAAFAKILAVAIAVIAVTNMLFSDVNWQNILIKIGFLGIFLICIYIFHLIGKDELRYLKGLAYKVLLRRKGDS